VRDAAVTVLINGRAFRILPTLSAGELGVEALEDAVATRILGPILARFFTALSTSDERYGHWERISEYLCLSSSSKFKTDHRDGVMSFWAAGVYPLVVVRSCRRTFKHFTACHGDNSSFLWK